MKKKKITLTLSDKSTPYGTNLSELFDELRDAVTTADNLIDDGDSQERKDALSEIDRIHREIATHKHTKP